jgi:hypothetical protein
LVSDVVVVESGGKYCSTVLKTLVVRLERKVPPYEIDDDVT